jgi:hypothetical protein
MSGVRTPAQVGFLALACASVRPVARRPRQGLLLGALLATLIGVAAGCTTDPTENNFYVRIVNDTTRTVLLEDCGGHHCEKRSNPRRLKPGATTGPFNFASVGVANPIAVVAIDGRVLGCLPLLFHRIESGRRVHVSTAQSC